MHKFYQNYYYTLINVQKKLTEDLNNQIYSEHVYTRIKSKNSTIEKLKKKNLKPTLEQAKKHLNDLIGVRVICRFIDDIYNVLLYIENNYEVLIVKDYIKNPKKNGYRSLHIIVNVDINGQIVPAEIQIRTISQDAWASLEHKMKYKKNIHHQKLIEEELKRCANEMAATDLTMQTINDMINEKIKI